MYYHVWCSILVVLLQKPREIITKASPEWPTGEYALLKPTSGCPEGWKDRGWIFQDTLDGNNRSEILHIDGYVARNYVSKSICINTPKKLQSTTNHITIGKWQKGKYCIYISANAKVHELKAGSISMYGEQSNENRDATKNIGSFVQIVKQRDRWYKTYIKFYFYCQVSGNKSNPIELPITKPFYLLPYGSRDCQQVKWMVATTEWIRYKTHDCQGQHKGNGTVPHYKLGDVKTKGITMYYCYYQSCNHTMNKTKGVFQSPGFPGKYPDGQLCSWRIMVPAHHVMHVRFTHFSLHKDGKDVLKYSKLSSGFKDNFTLKGELQAPFTVKSESDIQFVFRSNEEKHSTGFRAEYYIFVSRAETSTTKAPSYTKVLQTTKEATKPQSTARRRRTTKPNTSTIILRETTTERQSSDPINCTAVNNREKSYLNSIRWKGNTVAIVITLTCFVFIILLIIDIVCRCRFKTKNSIATSETRSIDHLPLVVNPTYDRGTIALNQPNNTTLALDVNDSGSAGSNQPLSGRPPDYEDIECIKLNKMTPNMNPDLQGCSGLHYSVDDASSDAHGISNKTAEKASKTTENHVYESIQTSPPFVEANALYSSTKVNQEKEKETEARKAGTENQEQQGRDKVDQQRLITSDITC